MSPSENPRPIERLLAEGARVMWVAAHPDDEVISGALLARACVHHGNPTQIVVLTRGEGGSRPAGATTEDLAAMRSREMAAVAERFGAELVMGSFWNAPLPVKSFPARHEIFERWQAQGDPVGFVAQAMRAFEPGLVLTFDPHHGATGHPEHQLVSRITWAAVREVWGGERREAAPALYHLLWRHPLLRLLGGADPGPVDEVFDGDLPCTGDQTCMDFLVEATRLHVTQSKDMGAFRRARRLLGRLRLRRVDPWATDLRPDEPA